ncbi:radical SAM protein [Methylocapsa polymorpha]|uniref:Radical SAM protein n=1 Tax=Methylocapsa polymorpha TaxID=3080828 RepID=A0ABZ0HUN3_9HYPH|nr:radical SAM protein [Methylocapsa sp. RX1]
MDINDLHPSKLINNILKTIVVRLEDSDAWRKISKRMSGASGMDILVVHPQYPGNPAIRYMPLGLAMVAAVAEREGHNVRVLDLHNQSLPYSALEDELSKKHYPLIMAGGFAMQVHAMREIVRRVRRLSVGSRVLLGGVGVSDTPELVLDYTGADAVCTHEAELVLPDILRAVKEGRSFDDCSGIVFRAGEEIVRRPGGSIPEDLDQLPYPAYHLFDIDRIAPKSYNGWGAKKSIHLMTSRGCPFQCTFCINSLLNDREYKAESFGADFVGSKKALRHRSPDSVIKEIDFLRHRYGITDFHFADEEFITHKDHLLRMCAALKKANVTWSTSARADWASEEKLAAMKDAGCRYIIFGIESGSQTIVDLMGKKAKVARVAEGIVNCYKVGMRFIPNFMIGYPGETTETIRESVAFCKALKIRFSPAFVTLFPNSSLFHGNKHKVTDWESYYSTLSNMDFNSSILMNLSDVPDEELKSLKAWGESECESLAVQEYGVDFSPKIHKDRWRSLPPRSGPPLTEVPIFLQQKAGRLAKADGFDESLKELQHSAD